MKRNLWPILLTACLLTIPLLFFITFTYRFEKQNYVLDSREAHAEQRGVLPSDLSFTFAGDIMAHTPNYTMQGYHRIYDQVKDFLKADDLSFANLEFVIDNDREMSSYPRFNIHKDYVEAAIEAGFDVFSVANNHINDFGTTGIFSTRRWLHFLDLYGRITHEKLVYFSGLRFGRPEKIPITTISYKDWKIGFLAVAGASNRHGSGLEYINYFPERSTSANDELIKRIKDIRKNYDLFVLSYHGGVEYNLEPVAYKSQLFSKLMEAGVDILWAHHPHVLQPVRKHSLKNGRTGIIMYSMGNFVSSQTGYLEPQDWKTRLAYTGDSVLLRVHVSMTENGPTVTHIDPKLITHLKYFKTDSFLDRDGELGLRDGYEVHYLPEAEKIADEKWKEFYQKRSTIMQQFIEKKVDFKN